MASNSWAAGPVSKKLLGLGHFYKTCKSYEEKSIPAAAFTLCKAGKGG